jgi:5'-nucleotidase
MRVLLSNDDGVGSPGIEALAAALGSEHEVWVVAPDRERSGCSHAITVAGPVVTREERARVYACSGLPVDCVNMALAHVLPAPPDVVVSGINLGANLGTDVLYSGTAAAARQAALRGLPAVAVSVAGLPPWRLEPAAAFVAANIALVPGLCPPGSLRFLNVNFPNTAEEPRVVRDAPLAHTRYTAEGESFRAPGGEVYHFYLGRLETDGDEPLTDFAAVHAGEAAVTLVEALPRAAGGLGTVPWRIPGARR